MDFCPHKSAKRDKVGAAKQRCQYMIIKGVVARGRRGLCREGTRFSKKFT